MTKKELKQILEEGEGQFIEFKEKPDKKLPKEIVAFANASGGRIFLGIDDNNVVKGINVTNKLKSQIIDTGKNCDPKIHLDLEQLKNVLIINVSEGENKPYQCSSGFYLRLGTNSQKLTRDKILEFSIKESKIRFDEQICENFDFSDFDDEKFENYLKLANISNTLDKKAILKNLKVLNNNAMTNAGVLFFAKNPYKYIGTSKIRCVLFKGNERLDILDKKEVDKGIIGNIEYGVTYLKEHIPVRFKIKGIRRIEYPQFPEEAYREAIVNAVIHRNYFQNGEVAVEKFQDTIYINNPGGLVPLLPKEDFGILSWPRNRLLADLLSRTYLMEKVGTGIKRIRKACKDNNNSVEFRDRRSYFFAIFKTTQKTTQKIIYKIIKLIKENPSITRKELGDVIGITEDGIKYHLDNMRHIGLLKRIGAKKGGHWKVIEQHVGQKQ